MQSAFLSTAIRAPSQTVDNDVCDIAATMYNGKSIRHARVGCHACILYTSVFIVISMSTLGLHNVGSALSGIGMGLHQGTNLLCCK